MSTFSLRALKSSANSAITTFLCCCVDSDIGCLGGSSQTGGDSGFGDESKLPQLAELCSEDLEPLNVLAS